MGRAGCYLIVEVVDLQLVAPSAVGEVEAAVFFREQLSVLRLFKERGLVKCPRTLGAPRPNGRVRGADPKRRPLHM